MGQKGTSFQRGVKVRKKAEVRSRYDENISDGMEYKEHLRNKYPVVVAGIKKFHPVKTLLYGWNCSLFFIPD